MIEAQSADLIRIFVEIVETAANSDYQRLCDLLNRFAIKIGELQSILVRMYEENIPAVFYQRVRRYLSGWYNDDQIPGGLLYGDESTPRKLAGGSAAQSPLIHCLDIVLGVRHAKRVDHEDTGVGSAGNYLVEMRRYMSANHRDFLTWLEDHVNIHELVTKPEVPVPIKDAFNECVRRLKSFRDKHMAMVSAYVNVQANKTESKLAVKGTGGSNPIPFLKEVRSHMDTVYIKNEECDDATKNSQIP